MIGKPVTELRKEEKQVDYREHNREIESIWTAYREDKPVRVPVVGGGMDTQTFLTMKNYSFKRYYSDPEFMIYCQLEMQNWCRKHIFSDSPAGLPEQWGPVRVDFCPVIAEAWLGCEVVFPEKDAPWVKPLLTGDNKNKLYDMEIPDPLHGNFMQKVFDFYQIIKNKAVSMNYLDRPVNCVVASPGEDTNGVFSDAVNLRGATELLQDMYDDPCYVHQLLSFITDSIIARKIAWRKATGREETGGDAKHCVTDHGIDMISVEMYKEFVLPYHEKLLNAFAKKGNSSVSLHHCGRGRHLFKTIYDEMRARTFFNLTYPVLDIGGIRKELGEEVYLGVGLHQEIVLNGPEDRISQAIERCLSPEVKAKGRLYWISGVFIPPGTPLKNIYAVYEAVKKFGEY